MIIAIDGPAGTGKSTVTQLIAKNLNFYLLNTGLFYRALTYQIQNIYKTFELKDINTNEISNIATQSIYEIQQEQFLVNGADILPYLRAERIEKSISYIASLREIREILNKKIRENSNHKNIVCEGRDTTTVVFPCADIKIYLGASLSVRALRRFNESYNKLSLQEIITTIAERDRKDRERSIGALQKAKDAIYIDSSDLTLSEVYEKVMSEVRIYLSLVGKYG